MREAVGNRYRGIAVSGYGIGSKIRSESTIRSRVVSQAARRGWVNLRVGCFASICRREELPEPSRLGLTGTDLARPYLGHFSEMPTMLQLDCFRVADVQRTITRRCDVFCGS
jgi:hypothetical protein